MTKEGNSLGIPSENPGSWLIKRSRQYLHIESPDAFAAHVRKDLQVIPPAGNSKVTSDLVYSMLYESGEKGKLAEKLLVTQLGERNEQGFFPLGRFDRPALVTTVIATLNGYHEELMHSRRRNAAKIHTIVSLVEPYLPRDKNTQKQLIDACKQTGISCATERYTEEEATVYDFLETQLSFFNKETTYGIDLAKATLSQAPLTIECGFDRLVGEGFLDPDRRGGTSGLHVLIDINPDAPKIDALEQFLQVFVLCDYNAVKAASYCQIEESTAQVHIDRLLQEQRISRSSNQGPQGKHLRDRTYEDFFVLLQESGYSVKEAAKQAHISYGKAKRHVEMLLEERRITLDQLQQRRRTATETQRVQAQLRYDTFMNNYAQLGSIREAAKATGIKIGTAHYYLYGKRFRSNQTQSE